MEHTGNRSTTNVQVTYIDVFNFPNEALQRLIYISHYRPINQSQSTPISESYEKLALADTMVVVCRWIVNISRQFKNIFVDTFSAIRRRACVGPSSDVSEFLFPLSRRSDYSVAPSNTHNTFRFTFLRLVRLAKATEWYKAKGNISDRDYEHFLNVPSLSYEAFNVKASFTASHSAILSFINSFKVVDYAPETRRRERLVSNN